MWGVDRLQVHGICNHRQVYRKVVEALDLYLNWIYIRLNAQAIYLIFFVCVQLPCAGGLYMKLLLY